MANTSKRGTRIRRLPSLCGLFLLMTMAGLAAQAADKPASLFTFPYFIAYQGSTTGVAIVNPNLQEASVTLALSGKYVQPVSGPVALKIPPRSQVFKTAAELFGTTEGLDAALVVSSATPGIIATTQVLDGAGTFLEGAGSVNADFSMHYPLIPGPQEGDSEISFFNPNIRPAAAELRLWNFGGDLIGWTTVQIPPGETFRGAARDIFPAGTSFNGASHVSATSKPLNVFSQAQSFAGSSAFWGFSSVPGPSGYVDVAILNAVPPTQLSATGVLPFFRTGSRAASFLALVNAETTSVDVNLTAVGNGGSVLATRKIQLKANGGSRLELQSIVGSGGTEGWILLSATGRICASLIHGQRDAASLAAMPLQKAPNFEFMVPHVSQGSGFYTELTLTNPASSAGAVDVYVAKSNGETVSSVSFSLSAGGRISQRIDTLLPEVVTQSGGYVYVRSNQALFCSALIGTDSGALLSNIGCQPLTVPFTPAPRKFFAVTGKVILDDKPAPGYKITLAGPVSGTTTSAADGSYLFKDLPVGIYTISIAFSSSVEFVPASTTFEIKTASWRQDFQGFTKPSVYGIVTMNGNPASGFQVKLTGPVSRTVTSGADGSYLFKELPPGSYSLTISSQTGFQFVPSSVNFDLARTSLRQDFSGSTEPNAIVVQPAAAIVASPETKVIIYGRDFNESSQASVGQVRLSTTYVDATLLKAVLPAYMLSTPLRFDVTVTTNVGTPAEWTSTPFTFLVYQENPVLSGIATPGQIIEGGPGVTLTLNGSGFLADTKVKINGSSDGIRTELINATQILADVPAVYFAHGGIYPVIVVNSSPTTAESNLQLLTVYYPAPVVQSISPGVVSARLEAVAEPLNLEVTGYGFRRGAVVLFNGGQLATTYCEDDAYCLTVRLRAKVPPGMLRSSGFAEITVRNPNPSLPAAEMAFLRIDGLQPTITSVVPGSATALNLPGTFSVPIVVNGTNFGPQTSIRVYPATTVPPPGFSPGLVLLGSTQLYTTVQIGYASIGQWNVEVANPQPGGGKSQVVAFFITEGTFVENPFLIVLSPTSVPVGGPAFTLTITGSNFKSGAQVLFRSTLLAATVVSSQVIQVEVPALLLFSAGRVPVSVINPDNGGASNRLYIDIR